MEARTFISISFFLFINTWLISQENYFLNFEVATKNIKNSYDTGLAVTTVNIFPPIIEWRYYPDFSYDRTKYEKIDSLYIKMISKGDKYGTIPSLENLYNMTITNQLKYLLSPNIQNVNQIELEKRDLLFLKKELTSIKEYFDYSLVKNYFINDSLFEFIKRFKGQQFVFFDVLAMHKELRYPKVPDLNWWTRIFVVDIRKREVIFYSFKSNYSDGGGKELKDGKYYYRYYLPNPENDFPRLKKSLKGYIKYLKQNKKHIEELKKDKK